MVLDQPLIVGCTLTILVVYYRFSLQEIDKNNRKLMNGRKTSDDFMIR